MDKLPNHLAETMHEILPHLVPNQYHPPQPGNMFVPHTPNINFLLEIHKIDHAASSPKGCVHAPQAT